MNILITSASAQLAQQLAKELARQHTVRLTDRVPVVQSEMEYAYSPLGHDAATNYLVRGIDCVVHVGEPLADEPAEGYLDYMTRATYNLLHAAAAEKVTRLIYLNSLKVMDAYDPNYNVTERWQPQPDLSNHQLGKHLGELVCKEFAREHLVTVAVLRLGEVVEDNAWAASVSPSKLALAEAVQAIEQALEAKLAAYSIFHIQSEFTGAKYPVGDAKARLGFKPQAGAASMPAQN
jgi:nucleoside-diphosphate-sugar epimerase